MEHDFEDIEIKSNALELLEYSLRHKRRKCMIGTGAMSDPYIPLESTLCHVRKAMQLIYEYGFGFTVQTKSDLVLRDLDLIKKINEKTKCVIQMTLTTYSEELCRKIEPNVCTTGARFEALKILRDAGIPTVVWLDPILPFINDTEENISGILDLCAEAEVYGIICFGMGLTLREGNREYFYQKLDEHFPGLKQKYIRKYGNSYMVDSENNAYLMKLFHQKCEASNIVHDNDRVFGYLHTFEEKNSCRQLSLWDL